MTSWTGKRSGDTLTLTLTLTPSPWCRLAWLEPATSDIEAPTGIDTNWWHSWCVGRWAKRVEKEGAGKTEEEKAQMHGELCAATRHEIAVFEDRYAQLIAQL